MRTLIKETGKTVNFRIYGVDGTEKTAEYFRRYLETDNIVYPTTDEERAEYDTDAVYTIVPYETFRKLADSIEKIQFGIDSYAERALDVDVVEYAGDYII